MARARNLKPSFFTNDLLAEIDPLGRLLFQGLWCIADREGRLLDRPKKIKAEILPFDNADIDRLLEALSKYGFIIRYQVDSIGYIQIINFLKHQNPHVKEAVSSIPAPDRHQTSTRQAPDKTDSCTGISGTSPADSLNPITDSLNPIKPLAAPDGLDMNTWETWVSYRKKIKKPIKPESLEAAMRKMAKLGGRQAEAVEESIANGWQGLFAPKSLPAKPPDNPAPQFRKLNGHWEQRDPTHGWFPVSETEVPENLRGAA